MYKYTSQDVDYMIGVDLEAVVVYVVPMAEIEKTHSSEVGVAKLVQYKEKFEVFQ